MLQTSSNRSNLKRLARTSVTNVVNLSRKTTIFSEKATGLTTFVTTDQKSTQKTPPIDDVCNNTHRSISKTQHDEPDRIGRPGGRGLRHPWVRRGLVGLRDNAPNRTSTHKAPLVRRAPEGPEGLAAAPEGPEGLDAAPERSEGRAAGRGARGWRRGLSGQRAEAPIEARGADGRSGCPRDYRQPNFARNLLRSFFEMSQKRCNSNDANSMFE